MTDDVSQHTVHLAFDRCPQHGFEALSLMLMYSPEMGSGHRLVGSKSCCSRRAEVWRSRALKTDELQYIVDCIRGADPNVKAG